MITAAQLRSARKAVMKQYLITEGFIEKGTLYVRKVGHQIHGIDFQASQYGSEYTINILFHYDFAPACFGYDFKHWDQFKLLDFALFTRLGCLKSEQDEWWPYAKDVTTARALLEENARESLQYLEPWARKWADPPWFLEKLSPQSLLDSVPIADGSHSGLPEQTIARFESVLSPWETDLPRICAFLCATAMHARKKALAHEYARIGRSVEDYAPWLRAITLLLQGKGKSANE